ncbi:MAG: (d)CMP kinase [Planctomycetota bacterium]
MRTREVTSRVSAYAAHPLVRAAMGRAQRRIGEDGDLVCEGRDMGTVVFPDAAVKIYLDASPAERARRRTAELREKGEAADEQSIRTEIERRDRLDSEREEAPLRRSPEQVYVDSSAKDRDSVVAELERLARERLEQLT